MLVDLLLSVTRLSSQADYTHVVNLHLPKGARPAIKPKHLVCKSYSLVPLQICNSAATIARPLRYVLRPKLSVQPAL